MTELKLSDSSVRWFVPSLVRSLTPGIGTAVAVATQVRIDQRDQSHNGSQWAAGVLLVYVQAS